jgi:hypothetical protein
MANVLRSHTRWAYILTPFGPVKVGTVEERQEDKVQVIIVTRAQALP